MKETVIPHCHLANPSYLSRMEADAILFDFDGVILDTEWSIYESMRGVFVENGHDLPLEEYVKCIGSDFNTWSPETMLEDLTGKTFDWQTIGIARNKWIREEIAKLDAMPGVRDAVDFCQEREIPTAIVSSSNHKWVDGWLEKLDLLESFDHIIAREDAPRIKPAPDLYAEAVRRIGLPAPKCLVIEDSLNGMKSAHEVGCPVAAIPNRITQCIDFSAAEYQYPSLVEFLEDL
ncbi:HAD-IA family hydrolase [Akkermansiaceae bacterium]|nr:HAD-IA family hydrolase [Akkermansiaceae bacterium]